ncbi:MAG: FAD-dependent thymidylate synthase [Spirochaetota bacterium]|nr:FAD-dependent thymidylate synthase [Spirochaetota bacterium]
MNIQDNLSQYVSNLDKNVYTVFNLPEEVIATVFAYVSRSPNSFRDNLLRVTEEKAKTFHEKWVLNYGHASVAELATVHIGIEKVSRLFSAILERSNLYISPIEYSQRYQKPKQGDFYIPVELRDPEHSSLKKEYIDFQNSIYDDYVNIFNLLLNDYRKNESQKENENDKTYKSRIEKSSFEDARYILTLATLTNLGVTANARAIEDTLIYLLSNEYPEVRQKGLEIKEEVIHSLPTLVKYAKDNLFLIESRNSLQDELKSLYGNYNQDITNQITLLDFTGKESNNPEEEVINIVLSEMLYQYGNNSLSFLKNSLNKENMELKLKLFNRILSKLGSHDNPPSTFEKISYKFELNISESCWHQFLRHRKINFVWQYPSVDNGFIVPAKIKNTKAKDIFEISIIKSNNMFKKLEAISSLTAHYVVTNAHKRCVTAEFSLWELYHLINLRMTPHAQWEIQNMMMEMVNQIKNYHPNLIQPALDRLSRRL